MNELIPIIKSSEEHKEFFTEEKCHILELLNESDDNSQSLARARVEPGISTKWHRLIDTSEIYYILAGVGEVELGDDSPVAIHPGDVVRIPPNMAQRITNTGDTDLVFLCYCNPAFGAHCYDALE